MSPAEATGPLFVELIGATGTGKTTLATALAEYLRAEGFRVLEGHEAILGCYGLACVPGPKRRSALVHPFALAEFCRYAGTREGSRLARLAVRLIARDGGGPWVAAGLLRNVVKRIGCHQLLDRLRGRLRPCDFVVWDEGVVHAAHNLFVHADRPPRRGDIDRFCELVPRPDVLVWVTAPPAQSAAVIRERGHPRVGRSAEAARAFAEHAHATFEMLASVPRLRGLVYRVDNPAGDGDEAARVAALTAFLGARRRRPAGRALASLTPEAP